jgi:hypothetical protein
VAHLADTEFVGAITLRGFAQAVSAFRLKAIRS